MVIQSLILRINNTQYESNTQYLIYLESSEISCLYFDRKKVGRLYDTTNVRELSSLTFLMILTLRIIKRLIKYYKRNFNSDVPC